MRRSLVLAALAAIVGMLAIGGAGGAGAGNIFEGFKCYRVTATNQRFVDVGTLKDQFETRESRIVGPVAFCNPTDKFVPKVNAAGAGQGGFTFSDSTAHLTCYAISLTATEPAFRVRRVIVADQFGERVLAVVRPISLCVSAEKEHIGSDFAPAFKCYKVRNVTPSFSPRERLLIDQFTDKIATILKPVSLCTTVQKSGFSPVVDAAGSSANAVRFLTCYSLDQGTFQEFVHVHDQFDIYDLTLGSARTFCLPSGKCGIDDQNCCPSPFGSRATAGVIDIRC